MAERSTFPGKYTLLARLMMIDPDVTDWHEDGAAQTVMDVLELDQADTLSLLYTTVALLIQATEFNANVLGGTYAEAVAQIADMEHEAGAP